jgi:hypothetical protein
VPDTLSITPQHLSGDTPGTSTYRAILSQTLTVVGTYGYSRWVPGPPLHDLFVRWSRITVCRGSRGSLRTRRCTTCTAG